jgi:hypothetical protein
MRKYLGGGSLEIFVNSEPAQIARTSGALIYVIVRCKQNLEVGYRSKQADLIQTSESPYI